MRVRFDVGQASEIGEIEAAAAAAGSDPNLLVWPEAVAIVRETKAAGWRVGVLSNDLELLYGREMISKPSILDDIDCVVDGSRSCVLKPSSEAFARALTALGSRAERTVSVDDQPRNVAGARAVGMHGICFDIRDWSGFVRRVAGA